MSRIWVGVGPNPKAIRISKFSIYLELFYFIPRLLSIIGELLEERIAMILHVDLKNPDIHEHEDFISQNLRLSSSTNS